MKRPGAFSVSAAIWDVEIMDFLSIKKKQGEERLRCTALYPAVLCDDVFMSRVKRYLEGDKEVTLTLFNPYDVPDLCECYGKEFEEKYLAYEEKFRNEPDEFTPGTGPIPIKTLLTELFTSITNDGFPYITFKDTVNNAHAHPQLGIIRCGNLCQEVMMPANEKQVAVCNLGSLNLARINGDEELLKRATKGLTLFLDNSIDITEYPSPCAKETQLTYRSIGVGTLGEAEYIANSQIHFGSEEHIKEIDRLYSIISNTCLETSKELANTRGSCVVPGIRNAYRMCIAPNTQTGLFASTTAGCEPAYGREWIEDNKNTGAVRLTAPNINLTNYSYYKNGFEIEPKNLVDAVAAKQKYVDMSISFSFFFSTDGLSLRYLIEQYVYAWEKKLKSIYYLRSTGVQEKTNLACSNCAN